MSKINILDKRVYNRIAAGEVVERPFSVVKELVENSIDAGAYNITIKLEDGGKKLISVQDDGCGIEKDDFIKALMPHATSKICNPEDLDKITTLGFRGEALASIAAVSEVTIISKTKQQEIGYTMRCDCGETSEIEPYPSENGTCIIVENLFCNTPARAKFLKPAKNEEADIANIVTRLIFAHPEISFKLFLDDKETVHSCGGLLDEAIIEIYGYETIKDCFKIDTTKNGIHISGFIGKSYFVKPNRTYQTVILNGRYIINSTVQSAIHNAYSSYLMKRKYPFYVLNIEINPEFVDVNVHPNKTDVRFVDNQVVYSTLYSVISEVLDGRAAALDIVQPDYITSDISSDNSSDANSQTNEYKHESTYISDDVKPSSVNPPVATRYSDPAEIFRIATAGRSLNYSNNFKVGDGDCEHIPYSQMNSYSEETVPYKKETKSSIDDIFAENKRYIEEMELQQKKQQIEQGKLVVEEQFRVVGQVLNTYLILEKDGEVYFIDQHAAHERLIYDQLIDEYKNNKFDMQTLLMPFLFNVNEKEAEFITDRFTDFRKMGIDVGEYDDGVFAVYSLPLMILDMDLKEFFDDVLSDMSLRRVDVPDILREKIAQKACKAAIKSGKILSKSEIDKLLEMLHGDLGLKCPHGRPIAIRITRTEIDKWFKRIV